MWNWQHFWKQLNTLLHKITYEKKKNKLVQSWTDKTKINKRISQCNFKLADANENDLNILEKDNSLTN